MAKAERICLANAGARRDRAALSLVLPARCTSVEESFCARRATRAPLSSDRRVRGPRARATRRDGIESQSMKPRYAAAALALVVWYLMEPPAYVHHGMLAFRQNAPFTRWTRGRGFDSEAACKDVIASVSKLRGPFENGQQGYVAAQTAAGRCVASDDPRLKGN